VIEQMAPAYPELAEHREQITRVIGGEEERFAETLERGMKLFEEAAARGAIAGADAFDLQATYGFPIELTLELARERGIPVDEEGYEHHMAGHREISRAGGGKGEVQRAADFARTAGFTTEFVGWEKTDVLTQIGALEEIGDGLFLAKLYESPFYPEGGGQVTDAGEIVEEDGTRATLRAAYRLDDDQALLFEGSGFAAGDRVRAIVPWRVRFPTTANHTATHLLHRALRDVLGEHVHQAGSAVRPDKLRFDFSHPRALTPDERRAVEQQVNEAVFENHPVRTYVVPIEEARNLGAMMLFGEKYGDEVRIVDVEGVSRELCGGTHVRSTAEIGPFVVLSESSVGAGARRIEAVTAGEAYALLQARAAEADELRGELERARKEARKPAKQAEADVVFQHREGNVVLLEVKSVKGGALRDLSDRVRQQEKADGAIVASTDDGQAYLVVNFADSLVSQGLDASQLVRELGKHIGGGGGGRPTLAEAGGRNPDGVKAALEAGRRAVADALA
jgi:alanyl-tRNA synthetase